MTSTVLAVIAANEGQKILTKKQFRSYSTDSGVNCQLTRLKYETIRNLAKRDIDEKLFQGNKHSLKSIRNKNNYFYSCN